MAETYNIQDFMNSAKFIVYDKIRIDNLVTNAQIASKIDYLKDKRLMEITFTDRMKGKKDSVVQYFLPIDRLSNPQISMLLSYKKKQNEKRKR